MVKRVVIFIIVIILLVGGALADMYLVPDAIKTPLAIALAALVIAALIAFDYLVIKPAVSSMAKKEAQQQKSDKAKKE